MSNVVVFKKLISANSNGFFKKDVSEQWIYKSMNMLESWSTVSMVKWNESLTVYLLVVNGSNSAVTASFFSGGNDTKVTKNVISLEYFLSYFLEYLKDH